MSDQAIVTRLRDRPALLDPVVGWIDEEWAEYSGRSLQQTRERFASELDSGASQLPCTLVATLGDQPAGVLSLREQDSTDYDPGKLPWICNVYVPASCRGKGIASALCLAGEAVAKAMGFDAIYLANEHGEASLYGAIDYRVYKAYGDERGAQQLMSKNLS
ncbi:MAG: GNAT family N-acetyltransferase [Pseudomonadota bacterium]